MKQLPFLLLLLITGIVYAGDLPPCSERPTVLQEPFTNSRLWCLERVIADDSAGEMAFTALATAPDGTLYATRPLQGEVIALEDSDGDRLPDTPHVVAENLTRPNSLTYAHGALYIAGGSHIYRLDDQLATLVDDLPAGPGFWTGGIASGPDDRIYVGTGAPCDFCVPAHSERGAILSFALDGSDKQVVATGFRFPAALAFRDGALWAVDSASNANPARDELNRVTPGAHYGWPYCVGVDNTATQLNADFDCDSATAPVYMFPVGSMPVGLRPYTHSLFEPVQDALLIVLAGAGDAVNFEGYRIQALRIDTTFTQASARDLIPASDHRAFQDWRQFNYGGAGLWPHHPYGIAVSPEGWIYISTGGGRIYALRPR